MRTILCVICDTKNNFITQEMGKKVREIFENRRFSTLSKR